MRRILKYNDWLDIYECQLDAAFQSTSENEYECFDDYTKEKYREYVEAMEDVIITEVGY